MNLVQEDTLVQSYTLVQEDTLVHEDTLVQEDYEPPNAESFEHIVVPMCLALVEVLVILGVGLGFSMSNFTI